MNPHPGTTAPSPPSTVRAPEKPGTPGTPRGDGGAPEWCGRQETLRLEPCSPDTVAEAEGVVGRTVNSALTAEVADCGPVRFTRPADGADLPIAGRG